MPKEEKQIDLKTGRVRRKALFEEEERESDDAASDEEDDQEEEAAAVSEDGSDGDVEDDAEEESDRDLSGEEMAVARAKRLKREAAKEATVNELPAFADSDDDLEMSSEERGKTSVEENEMEEDDEEEEEQQRSYESGSSDSEFEVASKRVAESKQHEINNEVTEMRSQISDHSLKRKAVLTTDSGNCTAEEASESEVENSSFDDGDDEGSHDELEAEESNRKGFRHTEAKKADTTRQTKLKAVEAEDDDVENLLREEEEYEEKIDFSADTIGRL